MRPNRKSTADLANPENKYQKINSLKLIHLVRTHEVLYNSDYEGYNDRVVKDMSWERIFRSLFPRYDSLSENVKDIISANVRRRWKTLRNAIAREVKKNATVENYIRKKESPVIAELEFLIPHIKSAHCAKLADELGLRDCYANVNERDEEEYDEDYNDTVDLTEEQIDIKPFHIRSDHKYNDVPIGSATVVPQEALYPTVQLNMLDESVNGISNGSTRNDGKQSTAPWRDIDSVVAAATAAANNPSAYSPHSASNNSNWRNDYCAVVQCKEGEFMDSTLLCTNPENEEIHDDSVIVVQTQPQQRQSKIPSPTLAKKRPRQNGNELANGNDYSVNGDTLNGNDTNEIQAKILRLLGNLERPEKRETRAEQDAQDEDRMFLLSLVSDLKRVPFAKKMLLKAEIAMAIARAVPP